MPDRACAHEIGQHTQGQLVWGKNHQTERWEDVGMFGKPDLASLKDEYRHKRPRIVPNQYFNLEENGWKQGIILLVGALK